MEQHFAALTKRQTMLLLTAVTYGGPECVDALAHLPDDEAELLRHRAAGLLQIPREKRIPLLVQEMKRLLTGRRRQLASADPERVAVFLRKERAAMVEVILRALPAEVADPVRAQLGLGEATPTAHEVKSEVLSIVRFKLEGLLARTVPKTGVFKFTDLLILQSRELFTICDRMGARVLATSLAGLSKKDRDELLQALPPDQRALAEKAAAAGASKKLRERDAKVALEAYQALKTPSPGLRSAGVQRLARACLAQGPEFGEQLLKRHGGDFGRMLAQWLEDERAHPAPRGDGGRADIVEQMERLAYKGVIDRPMRLPPPQQRPLSPPTRAGTFVKPKGPGHGSGGGKR